MSTLEELIAANPADESQASGGHTLEELIAENQAPTARQQYEETSPDYKKWQDYTVKRKDLMQQREDLVKAADQAFASGSADDQEFARGLMKMSEDRGREIDRIERNFRSTKVDWEQAGYGEMGVMDKAYALVSGATKGATQFTADRLKGLQVAKNIAENIFSPGGVDIDFDYGKGAAASLGEGIRTTAEEGLPTDERAKGNFMLDTVPQALGQVGAQTAEAVATGPLAIGWTALSAALAGGGSMYDQSIEAGATEEDAIKAAGLSAIWNSSDAIPIISILGKAKKISTVAARTLMDKAAIVAKQTAEGALKEGSQEFVQQWADDSTFRGIVEKDPEWWTLQIDSTSKAGGAGGIAGAMVAAAASILGVKKHGRTAFSEFESGLAPSPQGEPNAVQEQVPAANDVRQAPANGPPMGQRYAGYGELARESGQAIEGLRGGQQRGPVDDVTAQGPGQAVQGAEGKTPTVKDLRETAKGLGVPATWSLNKKQLIEKIDQKRKEVASGQEQVERQALQEGQVTEQPRGAAGTPAPPDGSKEIPPGVLGITARLPSISASTEKVTSWAKKWLTSKGHKPDEMVEAKKTRDGYLEAQALTTNWQIADLKKAVREVKKASQQATDPSVSKKLWDRSTREAMDEAAKTEGGINSLPEIMREPLQEIRDRIKALGEEMIDIGLATGDLAETIRNNADTYLNRSYEAFDKRRTRASMPSMTWDAMREYVKERARVEKEPKTDAQADAFMEHLLARANEKGHPLSMLGDTPLGAKNLGIFIARKDLPKVVRDFLGEYHDIYVNAGKTLSKMTHLIANHKFLSEIVAGGEGKWLFREPTITDAGKFVVRAAEPGTKSMEPLTGLFTSENIKAEINKSGDTIARSWRPRMLLMLRGYSKASATIYNPPSANRNIIGNPIIYLANGHLSFKGLYRGVRGLTAEALPGSNKGFREYIRRKAELGLLHQNVDAEMVNQIFKEASRDPNTDFERSVIMRIARLPAKYWNAGDAIFKIMHHEAEMADLRKAYPEWSQEHLERAAADIVLNTTPSYHLAPRAVKALRYVPLADFPMWTAEVIRTTKNILAQGLKEVQNPRTQWIGVKRLAGFAAAMAIPTTLALLARKELGLSKDDDDNLRHFVPYWSAKSTLLWMKDKAGNLQYLDLSFTDPYSYFKKIVGSVGRPGTIEDKIVDGVKEMLRPFVDEGILGGAVVDLLRNKTRDGKRVFNPESGPVAVAEKMAAYLWNKAFDPGFMRSIDRLSKAYTGERSASGTKYETKNEVWSLAGFRSTKVDITQSLGYKPREFQERLSNATYMFTGVAGRRGTVTDQEIIDAYREMDASRRKIFGDMQETAKAAVKLGLDPNKVTEILDESIPGARGMSIPIAKAAVEGTYIPYAPSKKILAKLDDQKERDRRWEIIKKLGPVSK
jgi:hypothetical protein